MTFKYICSNCGEPHRHELDADMGKPVTSYHNNVIGYSSNQPHDNGPIGGRNIGISGCKVCGVGADAWRINPNWVFEHRSKA